MDSDLQGYTPPGGFKNADLFGLIIAVIGVAYFLAIGVATLINQVWR